MGHLKRSVGCALYALVLLSLSGLRSEEAQQSDEYQQDAGHGLPISNKAARGPANPLVEPQHNARDSTLLQPGQTFWPAKQGASGEGRSRASPYPDPTRTVPLSSQTATPVSRQWPYATLLVLLLFMTIGRSLIPHGAGYDEGMRKGSTILTLMTCAWVIGKDRHRLLIAACLALGPIIAQFLPGDWSRLQLLLNGAFYLYSTILILRNVFSESDINADKLFGSVCAYMLLALIFALAYTFLELNHPGSFRIESHSSQMTLIFDELLYFSLVTMTTLGYGDIVPISREARALTTGEAIFGQFYIAVLVGRLLSLYMEFHRNAQTPSDPPIEGN